MQTGTTDKVEIRNILEESYGQILESKLLDKIAEVGAHRIAQANDILIDAGEYIKQMPLLVRGAIKIIREDKDGHELFLYYLERGDTCAFSLTCCVGNKKSEIKAIVEEETELILIPMHYMDQWIKEFATWRDFVFESYNQRLEEMLVAIDSIAFLKLDERLMKYLSDKVKVTGDTHLSNTHQQIADELNTSRVVVSRLLKQLEHQGKVKISRNKIEVLDF
jgi:CRP/FNR family transcriptional regulator